MKSFTVPEKNSYWMAYLHEKKMPEKQDSVQKNDSTGVKKEKKGKTPEAKGTEFVIFNPVMKKEFSFRMLLNMLWQRWRNYQFLQEIPDTTKIENFKVNVFDTKGEVTKSSLKEKAVLKKIAPTNQVKSFHLYILPIPQRQDL